MSERGESVQKPILEVEDLKTSFFTDDGEVKSVDGVDFVIHPNETLGMVGESGCGKSVTSLSIMRLIDSPGKIVGGSIRFRGEELLTKSPAEMRKIRGNEISMIFQEPMTSLNPVHTVGAQIVEALVLHRKLTRHEAMLKALDMLKLVGIPAPDQRINEYPHQLSGGMRQRVMIAMALSCDPKLLIADEPTTALDVTIQAQILDLMKKLKNTIGSSVMLITHDLGVIAELADNVVVLYAGEVVEYADVKTIFEHPKHPYTIALLESIPRLTDDRGRKLFSISGNIPDPLHRPGGCPFHTRCRFAQDVCASEHPPLTVLEDGSKVRCWMHVESHAHHFAHVDRTSPRIVVEEQRLEPGSDDVDAQTAQPLLQIRKLVKHFPIRGGFMRKVTGHVRAVDNVSFDIMQGETFGLVGESGCGKSTTGRLALRLLEPTSGEVEFDGRPIVGLNTKEMRRVRREMQIIFQDPFASLNPRMTVGDTIADAFAIHHLNRNGSTKDKVAELMKLVGLEPDYMRRYPHQFSGGQRQRIGVARAIALDPRLIICDEPVSALDVSIQAQIINLLEDLQKRLKLSYLFIAHDLSVVKHISDRVAVMYLGKIVELAETEELFSNPLHPYTEGLLAAVPVPDTSAQRNRIIISGDVPSPSNPPSGCRFHTRCPIAQDICKRVEPVLEEKSPGHIAACHFR
ncbi:MAG: ABC transporter ATP-binding protein [Spirochaetaceae bacterium]|nr:MAG: ABC transporter ATP-binding protein [Spirochaetaceae bacterium]